MIIFFNGCKHCLELRRSKNCTLYLLYIYFIYYIYYYIYIYYTHTYIIDYLAETEKEEAKFNFFFCNVTCAIIKNSNFVKKIIYLL